MGKAFIQICCQYQPFQLKLQLRPVQPCSFLFCGLRLFLKRGKELSAQDLQQRQKVNQVQQLKMQENRIMLRVMPAFPSYPLTASEPPKPPKRAHCEDNDQEQQSFQPDYHHLKKLGIKVNKKRIQTGGWSAAENQTYLNFMIDNINDFVSEKSRRNSKVFYRLSKILKRRTPDQCRSHHQKLQMKYHEDLNSIIDEVFRKIQKSIAQDFVNQQHRLFRPSFLCFDHQARLNQLAPHYGHQPQTKNQSEDFGWYSVSERSGCIRLEIKTESIEDWTHM